MNYPYPFDFKECNEEDLVQHANGMPDIDYQDEESGHTILSAAVFLNNMKAARIAIFRKANVNIELFDDYHCVPIDFLQSVEMAKLLVLSGANVRGKRISIICHLEREYQLAKVKEYEIAMFLFCNGAYVAGLTWDYVSHVLYCCFVSRVILVFKKRQAGFFSRICRGLAKQLALAVWAERYEMPL